MKQPLRIAVVGYGTAGQALAIVLARAGHTLEVFERVPQPGPVGAGFLLQPTGLQVLWKLGLLPQVLAHGAPVRRLYGETPCGRAVMDMRYRDLDSRLFGLGMQRGALFSMLEQAWDGRANLRAGTAIVEIDAAQRRLRDAHGHWHGGYDLVVVADGAASTLRHHVAGTRLDRPYPWGALWCLLPQQDWAFADELRQRYVAARRMIGLLPVGTRPGDPVARLSFFWSLPRSGFDAWEAAPLQAWLDEVAAIWPQARERLHGIDMHVQLARASYRDTVQRRWFAGRVVLAGDAAHSMSPQLGQGVNMALMDALALGEALQQADDVEHALTAYQRARQAHLAIYHFWSRWLTPLFQSEHDVAARLRDLSFLPMGRMPGGRGHMLRVLSGTQRGWWGRHLLEEAFLADLEAAGRTAAALHGPATGLAAHGGIAPH